MGDVQVFGSGRYAMRIWLNPEKMAALNITARDVMLAVQAQNAVNPAGKIGAQPAPPDQQLSFTVKAPGRLTSVKEFENIVVRGQGSSIVRVGDVARVELGSETYSLSSSVNGMPAASIGIYEAPGGNAIQLVDNIKALLNDTEMPPGMDYLVSLDSTLAVRAGIEDIVSTLVIALGLVVLVVFIFLQGWRGTLIPAFAVPVSIVGAFIAFPFFGFSINTICLMGLVLAIGLVVDDAIVVVEAVKNHISNGEKPLQATIAAMKEVSGPIVSTAMVISCVFVPTPAAARRHGQAVRAVRRDYRHVHHHFRLLRPVPSVPPPVRRAAERRESGFHPPAGALLQVIQQGLQQGARLVRGNLCQAHPAHVAFHPAAGRHDRPPLPSRQAHSHWLPSQ